MSRKILFGLAVTLIFFSCQDPAAKNTNDLQTIVEEVNKKCPQVIDSETRFDGLAFKAPNTLVYKYTLLNVSEVNVDTAAFARELWPGILGTIRVSPEMQPLRDSKTTLEYEYNDKFNRFVYRFTIHPDHYQ